MARLKADRGHGRGTWPPSKGIAAAGGVPGMAEHDFNAAVMDEAERLLKGKLPTFSAQGSNKPDVPLNTRIKQYNAEYKKDPDSIGISAHGNANGKKSVRGFGVFYWQGSKEGKKLAEMVLAEYKREFPDLPLWGDGLFESKRGTWSEYAILRDTFAPFVLVEFEFFTNDAARKLMLTADYRKRCGAVVARAASKWYGIKLDEKAAAPAAAKPASSGSILPSKGYLGNGDKGSAVGTLQASLNEFSQLLKLKPLVIDNSFGPLTVDFLKAWQRRFKLEPDGYFGKASAAMMEKQLQELAKAEKAAREAELKKAEKLAAAKPGAAKYRVLVNGKQTGAYSLDDNAIRAAEQAIEAGADNIQILEIK